MKNQFQSLIDSSPNIIISFLPPSAVLQSVIDAYFEHVHNQPYSFFRDPSFRARIAQNLIPRCLVLAVLASAVRFSSHKFYAGKVKDATSSTPYLFSSYCPSLQFAFYHPFILRLTLRRFKSKLSPSFAPRAIRHACQHAKQLIDVLWNALDTLVHRSSHRTIHTTFWWLVASILWQCILKAKTYNYAPGQPPAICSGVARLDRFHTQSYQYASIMDHSSPISDLDPMSEEELWSMIDYGTLCSIDPTESTLFPSTPPQLQPPDTWWLENILLIYIVIFQMRPPI
ncbi:unnamed protein product [Penicillium nalgiovense]|uniref:Transcription factor domain-containing protein n=1 Tax=Penicillium nalgiovense TaxID=60175 RepID=A0A9W4HLN0_PENNA|nr:unnamed protein product [Penicillium nalgiovense]CAG8017368.1 unnamed protein product [Penicillium nalgiovense]CAG8032221.1 unnamed protein product [Penicillium nalgiovense]CAG8049534.1 unnamed protein product [Penicillium nalgiovense]CAG8052632.1 unnamed protein product [Penicillium nalgiovense]